MPAPALLAVAHGSRDPRHAATVRTLVRSAAALRPGVRVETAFLDFDEPSVPKALAALAAGGAREAVAVPLLLNRAFHAKADLPAVLRQAPPALRVRPAEVLGPSPLLLRAVERRLYETGLTPPTGPRPGSSWRSRAPPTRRPTRRPRGRRGNCGAPAGTPCGPRSPPPPSPHRGRGAGAARRGARRVAVAPYVIAPGRLSDRIAKDAAGADALAEVLGPAPNWPASCWTGTTAPARPTRRSRLSRTAP